MAGRIIYLEIDDEITSAASRIRASDSESLAVVLPNGSRVATSRINFRLLARDALTHEKRLSIVSGDPATRALAASAGLPVFASVSEYESSLVGADEESRPETWVPVVSVAAAAAVVEPPRAAGSEVPVPAVPPAPLGDTIRTTLPRDPTPTSAVSPSAPTTRPGRGGRRTSWLIGGAILALAALIGGVGLYLLLPSARIVVTPRPEAVGPIQLTVVADPNATAPSVTPPVIPATLVSIPVEANDTFSATGKRVELTKATGTVRFQNLDPTATNRIAAGSIVKTAAGVRFRTNVTITVPKSELIGFQIFPAKASVNVTAVDGGPDGNVEAGKIVIVPSGENGLFLKVTNPEATTGGNSQEFPRVTQADVDAALGALNLSLQESFRVAMADPALTAGGATVFPESGTLGAAAPTVPPESLVGQEVATFALGLSATGTVVTADTTPVAAIADTQVRAAVEPGHELVPGSVDIEVGEGVVIGQTVSFPVTATAEQVAILDPAQLEAKVLGKSATEAKAILAPYGEVELTISPDWVGSVPSFESRVDLTIGHAVEIETPLPSGPAPS